MQTVNSGAKKEPQSQKIARTAPKNFLNNSRGYRSLPIKTRALRQIAPESSPESSAKSLSQKFFGVPFLCLIVLPHNSCGDWCFLPFRPDKTHFRVQYFGHNQTLFCTISFEYATALKLFFGQQRSELEPSSGRAIEYI